MVAIPWPTTSMPGQNRQEGAGRLVNCFAEPLGENARSKLSIKRVPGMRLFASSDATGYRGAIEVNNTLYAAFNNQILKTGNSGGSLDVHGQFNGSAKCFFARNNNAIPDVVVIDPNDGASVITTSGVQPYPDNDVGSPNSVCYLGGYFFFTYGDGRCRSTGINTTDINSNDFTTAEYSPDGLLRAVPWNNQLYLFGTRSTEVLAGNPPNDTGFPFSRVTIIQRGLVGRYALAGWEEGFSKGLFFVAEDNAVYVLNGYQPEKISPPDLDRLLEATVDKNAIEASVYTSDGRSVLVISGPTYTWEFNVNSLKWNERASHDLTRWRGTQSLFAFNKWLTGTTDGGNIYQITSGVRNEGGNPLRAITDSAPVHKFPAGFSIERIDLDVTTGVGITNGTANQVAPSIELSVSQMGDGVFGIPRILPLGERAVTTGKVYATRFGRAKSRGVIVRAAWSDEVDISLLGGDLRPGAS